MELDENTKKRFFNIIRDSLSEKEVDEFSGVFSWEDIVRFCEKVLCDSAHENHECCIDDDGTASISITGNSVKFYDANLIMAVSEIASNLEIYPRTDNVVCVEFTFYKEDLE